MYAVDSRNHGDSSHHPTHTYTALAEDLELFLSHHNLAHATLIGHSMGAKTVMAVALRKRVPLGALIPVDNAPVDAALKSDFPKYVRGMREIEQRGVASLKDADAILRQYEDEVAVRQFLLTNLHREPGREGLVWRIPLKILADALAHMGDFPFNDPEKDRWEGPTLVVRGTKSAYVADEALPIIGRFFPKFEVRDIKAGHWVIAEQPEEFRRGKHLPLRKISLPY